MEMLKQLSAAELDKVIERATALRLTRVFRFMDLPPELRSSIYRLAIPPEDIEKHVTKGKAPILLQVNRQIHAEFRGLYYSHEFMSVKYYEKKTKSWKMEPDAALLPLILSKRGFCSIRPDLGNIDVMTRDTEATALDLETTAIIGELREGVFTWKEAPQDVGTKCRYYTRSVEIDAWRVETRRICHEMGLE